MTGKAGVVDIVEVEILYGLGTQKDDQDGRVGTLAWTKLIVDRAVVRMTNSATAEVMKACWTRRLHLRSRHYSSLISNLCLLNSREKAVYRLHAVVQDADRDGAALLPEHSESRITF